MATHFVFKKLFKSGYSKLNTLPNKKRKWGNYSENCTLTISSRGRSQ